MADSSTIISPELRRAIIAAAYDPETLRAAGIRLAGLAADHFERVQQGQGPVLPWELPSRNIELASAWLHAGDIAPRACSAQQDVEGGSLVNRFAELVGACFDRGQHIHHPHYVGHQVPASIPLAGWFDAVGALTNQGMAIYEMGPWATAVEQAVVNALGEAIGFTAGSFGGLATSGGSLANLTALLAARNASLDQCWQTGMTGRKPAPVLVAHADSHYCVTRAAGIMGLGTENVVPAPLDSLRRIDAEKLDELLASLRGRGVPIVALAAAACATPIGAFDRIDLLAEICRRHDVWLHVDAAHGGAAALSAKHRHLVAGLADADSVVCDAHKMLFMPALCTLLFYRDKQSQFGAFQQSAPYLFDPSAPGMAEFDSAPRSLECTKRAATLGLWGLWSLFGRQLFEALVDETFERAVEFYQLLSDAADFEAYCRPQCNIVVFRRLPAAVDAWPDKAIDELQLQIRRSLIESGEFYITQTRLDGRTYLRATVINPLTRRDDLVALLDCLRKHTDLELSRGGLR